MATRIFDLLLRLYPADFRAGFGREMRAVLLERAESGRLWDESVGLLCGAVREHSLRLRQISPSLAGGAILASGLHWLVYYILLSHKSQDVARLLRYVAARLFVLCLLVGLAFARQPRQDPAALETARSIYQAAFTALREARTLDDLHKLSDGLDAPGWISVDWFGRTILTGRRRDRRAADRELQSMLALPPARRVTGMEVIWAGQDSDRLVVLAWMMPNQADRIDTEGGYGPQGATHHLTRATLIRDVFRKTGAGWRRIRHDKLTPNDIVLAVDGAPRIIPPLDRRYRVTPAR